MATIIIAESMYVGFSRRSEYDFETKTNTDCTLSFATYMPLDDSKKQRESFARRKRTVDDWALPYRNQPTIPAQTLKNELLSGYKIAHTVKRTGWNGGNVVWRMEDPRGWEFEIQSGNMARILECGTISKGEVVGRCIFGWEGGRLVLLPEDSDIYQEAQRSTDLFKADNISLKDIVAGDTVVLKSGETLKYYGRFYSVERKENRVMDNDLHHSTEFAYSSRSSHFFLNADGTFRALSSPKVKQIIQRPEQPLDPDQVSREINAWVDSELDRIKYFSYNYPRSIYLAVATKLPIILEMVPLTLKQAKQQISSNCPLYVFQPSGKCYLVSSWSALSTKASLSHTDISRLSSGIIRQASIHSGRDLAFYVPCIEVYKMSPHRLELVVGDTRIPLYR